MTQILGQPCEFQVSHRLTLVAQPAELALLPVGERRAPAVPARRRQQAFAKPPGAGCAPGRCTRPRSPGTPSPTARTHHAVFLGRCTRHGCHSRPQRGRRGGEGGTSRAHRGEAEVLSVEGDIEPASEPDAAGHTATGKLKLERAVGGLFTSRC